MNSQHGSDVRASVVLITYNHERYLAQAIESVLSQRTSFAFELLISEDHSTDRTREIAERYRDQHPDRIRLLLSPENLCDNSVVTRAILAARGDYVALLDGDDYWTSPDKLQKQVDFLDEHGDCSICFHNVQVVYEDGDVPDHPFHLDRPTQGLSTALPAPTSGLRDLVKGNFIQTCSVLLRASARRGPIPDWYVGLSLGDWPLYILYAEGGDIGYLDETLAAYRVHGGGLWSSRMSRYQSLGQVRGLLEIYDILNAHLDRQYEPEIRRASSYLHREAVVLLLSERRYRLALRQWRAYAAGAGFLRALNDRHVARTLVRAVIGRAHAR